MITIDRLAAALGRTYCVDRDLGAGGIATVFLAQDLLQPLDRALETAKADTVS